MNVTDAEKILYAVRKRLLRRRMHGFALDSASEMELRCAEAALGAIEYEQMRPDFERMEREIADKEELARRRGDLRSTIEAKGLPLPPQI